MAIDFGDRDGAMWKWLEGSAFSDGGRPTVLFHGTDLHEPFNIFTHWEGEASVGFHFGTREVANSRIDEIFRMAPPDERAGVIIPVICRAGNPLYLHDLYTWQQDDFANALHDAGVLATEQEVEWAIETYSEARLFAAMEEAGFDCLVYGNVCEHKTEVTDSVMIWRAEQLKSPFAASFDPADPRLLPQNETPAQDYDRWRELAEDIAEARRDLARLRANAPGP